ncbi:hypothetical protein BMJ31_30160 [Sinorhizobium medicae]|nr:hypothetical protein BMJ31_30160 [Sinorhizobium medicae]
MHGQPSPEIVHEAIQIDARRQGSPETELDRFRPSMRRLGDRTRIDDALVRAIPRPRALAQLAHRLHRKRPAMLQIGGDQLI